MYKLAVFIAALMPALILFGVAGFGQLGPDPGKELVLNTGILALYFLWFTLAITPFSCWFGWKRLMRYRRMMGLYSFFYACLHLLLVGQFLLGWSLATIAEEFKERPYMALGITAWLLMVPLALTSNRWAIKTLKQYWKPLHRLVYVIAMLVAGHYLWQIRSDFFEPVFYSVLLAVLLLSRLGLRDRILPVLQRLKLRGEGKI